MPIIILVNTVQTMLSFHFPLNLPHTHKSYLICFILFRLKLAFGGENIQLNVIKKQKGHVSLF